MSTLVPDLWPVDIKTDVLSPVAVLRHQAGQLRQRTKGLLEAEVMTDSLEGGVVSHRFVIIAPALGCGSFVLFRVSHSEELVYPVQIQFKPWTDVAFQERKERMRSGEGGVVRGDKSAADQEELLGLLREVFSAPYTRSVLTSLLAKINETNSGLKPSAASSPPEDEQTERTEEETN